MNKIAAAHKFPGATGRAQPLGLASFILSKIKRKCNNYFAEACSYGEA